MHLAILNATLFLLRVTAKRGKNMDVDGRNVILMRSNTTKTRLTSKQKPYYLMKLFQKNRLFSILVQLKKDKLIPYVHTRVWIQKN